MLAVLAIALFAHAQDSIPVKDTASRTIAIPRATHTPTLDGKLNDAVWREAAQLGDFIQGEPLDQAPPAERSIAYVAYDAHFFYFAFRAYEHNPGLVRATVFPRERGGETDDRVTLLLDTFLDKRRAFEFKITPLGIQSDGIKVEGQRGDPSPDFVWYSAGSVDDEGWVVEAMIPWASLRFPNSSPLNIGFNAVRVYGRNGEKDSWVPRRRGNPCDVCQEGILTGITDISRRRTVDILPYVFAAAAGTRNFRKDSASANGVFFPIAVPTRFSHARPVTTLGGDIRFPLTTSLVLNGTFNPDFSQVESDDEQIRVNQRFTLFQQERRPFFLEGKDVFENVRGDEEQRTNVGDLFYSRSIVDPSAGVRLTAKQGGWTVGSLFARDHSPSYFYYNGYESSGSTPLADLPGEIFVVRARRDVLSDSYVGAGLWSRGMKGAQNVVGSGDFSLRRGAFTLSGEGALSEEKAPRLPKSSAALDGAVRHGKYYRARLARSGRALTYAMTLAAADSLFRDQIGRFARIGIEQYAGRIELSQYPNSRVLQRFSQSLALKRTNAFAAGLLDYAADPGVSFQFQRQTGLSVSQHLQLSTISGVPVRVHGSFLDFHSDAWQYLGVGGSIYFGGREIVDPANPRAGTGYFGNIRLTLRPLPQASIEARGQRSIHANAWGKPHLDDAKIIRVNSTYQFSRGLGVRLIAEHSNQYNSITANPFSRQTNRNSYSGLVVYELGPASFFYAGYGGGTRDFDAPVVPRETTLRTDSQLFVKLSYLFRL